MNKDESKQILDYLTRIDESINGPRTSKRPAKDKRPLSDRVDSVEKRVGTLGTKVDKLDNRVSEVQLGLATLAASTKANFQKVDARFEKVDRQFANVDLQFKQVHQHIDQRTDALQDLGERIHQELVGRIIDLETPRAGGSGTRGPGGGSGVPLAS